MWNLFQCRTRFPQWGDVVTMVGRSAFMIRKLTREWNNKERFDLDRQKFDNLYLGIPFYLNISNSMAWVGTIIQTKNQQQFDKAYVNSYKTYRSGQHCCKKDMKIGRLCLNLWICYVFFKKKNLLSSNFV